MSNPIEPAPVNAPAISKGAEMNTLRITLSDLDDTDYRDANYATIKAALNNFLPQYIREGGMVCRAEKRLQELTEAAIYSLAEADE